MVKDDGLIISKYTTNAHLGAPSWSFVPAAMLRWPTPACKINSSPFCGVRFNSVASLHLSSNVFTNTLISELKRALFYVGVAGLLVGGLAGWFAGKRRAKPRLP